MKKAYRIGYWRFYDDAEFEKLLQFILRYKDCIDELALFTEYSHHGYYPVSYIQDLCLVLKKRIPALKKAGIRSVGINVLDTLGHIDEAWDILEAPPFGRMMGHDGSLSRSCLCPNGTDYRQYIRTKYQMLAETDPDFIWVDDDIRMHHHSVAYACFCPCCMELFNKANATSYTREELVEALNSSDGQEVRRAWLEQNNKSVTDLMKWICESVHAVNPDIRLGLMTSGVVWGNYSNPRLFEWMDALGAAMGRPGGGFSDDDHPLDFVRKIHECGRQIPLYSDKVSDIQYELENFPYQRLSKSVHMVILECTASFFAGHNGIAFNAISCDDYPELLEAIRKQQGMWDTIQCLAGEFIVNGLYPCFDLEHAVKRTVRQGDWFNSSYAQKVDQSNELNKIGIPLTMDPRGACAYILIGTMPEAYSEEALKSMLSQGAVMDGQALEILLQRGFGDYCGVKIAKTVDNGVYERIYDHPFNGVAAKGKRDPYITFWGDDSKCYVLEKTDRTTEFISGLETIQGEPAGPCLSLYRNPYGGHVAVCGFMPWKFIGSIEKRYQVNAICEWVSKGQMPVQIEQCTKVIPFIRRAEDGRAAMLMLVNGFLDETGPLTVKVKVVNAENVCEIEKDGSMHSCEFAVDKETNQAVISLRSMKAWEFIVLYVGSL